ncbi:MAG: hypothetical protein WCQ99_06510 [Pseudomonadota bacterium]
MNLASLKTSPIAKRKLFEVERAIVREVVDLWCKEKSYCNENFAEDVDVEFKGRRIEISFSNNRLMQYGAPEATVNEVMKGLILTMATDPATGKLLKNYEAVIGNILDVFVHRLKEIGERKFVFQRLQTLELGFSIAFGLAREFYPIKKTRRLLEEVVTVASLSAAEETADILIHDMLETASLAPKEHGVTFHIVMVQQDEASFISLPFRAEQTSYVSLLGTHTLRCNILAELEGCNSIRAGILKIDAPSNPLKFMHYKGLELPLEKSALMEKLGTAGKLCKKDFSTDELSFLKLLFNEYVQLAWFLLSSKKIAPGLRLLIIFPRVNIFSILHEENPAIPAEEPLTLGELASLLDMFFPLQKSQEMQKRKKSHRIPERVIQEKVSEAFGAFARNILHKIYKPVSGIRRELIYYAQHGFADQRYLGMVKQRVDEISSYMKKLNRMQGFVLNESTKELDVEASIAYVPPQGHLNALEEIVRNIQAAEIDQVREVIVSKMLDYLSFIAVRLEQAEKVSSLFIKEEIVKEMSSHSKAILDQARSFYRLMGKREKNKH